jgi:2TM domain
MSDTSSNPARQNAVDRLQAKRAYTAGLVVYVVVNVFLWILWAVTNDGDGGIPWPLWVTLGWGFGMAMGAFGLYGRKPISDADIEREMRRG